MQCQHCQSENPERWFYCRECGKRAHKSNYTTNMWMMSEFGKRTDVEFNVQTMDENIKEMTGSNRA